MRLKNNLLVMFLFSAAALAQTTATIVGTVTDSSGAVVPSVSITVTAKDTGLTRKATTNQSGNYVVTFLPVGQYSVTAEVTGFRKKTVTGIVLEVNQERRWEMRPEEGDATDSVTVSGESTQLQTESAVMGQ